MRRRVLVPIALLASVLATLPVGAAPDACTEPLHAGGEWPGYGRDLANSRHQPAESTIAADNVADLEVGWSVSSEDVGASGIMHGTPTIAGGCLFGGTSAGWVFALDADTGNLVWRTQLPVGVGGLLGTGVVGSVGISGDLVVANVSQSGAPYTAALDRSNGDVIWTTQVDDTPLSYSDASAVVFDGLVFSGFVGDESSAWNRGGYAILDAATGDILEKRYTIPEEDQVDGFKGGGIWATAAVDPQSRYAFVGTANSTAGRPPHDLANAIIKIDLDPSRETFGDIVASYSGNPERYHEALDLLPGCQVSDEEVNIYVRSAACLQQDLDFGASPQLFGGPDGLLVGALQKSGVYHVARADTMERAWMSVVAPPLFYANLSTAATDGERIYVGGSPPGQLIGLGSSDGAYAWAAPIADALHFNGISSANGVIYAPDSKGFLNAYDAGTGVPLLARPMGPDIDYDSGTMSLTSAGAAIAQHSVYVAIGSHVIAYRLPTNQENR